MQITKPSWCPLNNLPTWIDIKDRLPNNNDDVLVILKDNNISEVQIGWYDEHWRINGITDTVTITHWQPLPQTITEIK